MEQLHVDATRTVALRLHPNRATIKVANKSINNLNAYILTLDYYEFMQLHSSLC